MKSKAKTKKAVDPIVKAYKKKKKLVEMRLDEEFITSESTDVPVFEEQPSLPGDPKCDVCGGPAAPGQSAVCVRHQRSN
jgi:hypothetical protein